MYVRTYVYTCIHAYIHTYIHNGESKKGATLYMAITLSILDRFAKFFHCCKEQ